MSARASKDRPLHLPRILAVDDDQDALDLMARYLAPLGGEIVALRDSTRAPRAVQEKRFDLAVLDIMMPGLDGIEVCRRIKADPSNRDCCVIFMTAVGSEDKLREAFEAGAHDYLTKPIRRQELLIRARAALRMKESLDEVHRSHADMQASMFSLRSKHAELEKACRDLKETQRLVLLSLAKLTESRDMETGRHLLRVQRYVELLARSLQRRDDYRDVVTEDYLEGLVVSAPLHDIGKVAIPDQILLKPDKLSPSEFEVMKQHTEIGARTLEEAAHGLSRKSFLDLAIEISRFHHERNDGQGYLRGLHGEEIPLSARLMSLVDHYDALRSKRIYKKAFSHERARHIILHERGTGYFHPHVLEAFRENEGAFAAIAAELKD